MGDRMTRSDLLSVLICITTATTACNSSGSDSGGNGDGAPRGDDTPGGDTFVASGDEVPPGDDNQAPGEVGPSLIVVANAASICGSPLLSPDPGEEDHWCAARLTPPVYPLVVVGIRYYAGNGAAGAVTCDASLAHKVELYAETTLAPPATPIPVAIIDVPAVDPSTLIPDECRNVEVEVDPPVTLTSGQHLFVAVQFAGTHPNVFCIQVNSSGAYEADRNYWSSAAAAPFSWVTLDSFGLTGSLVIQAVGYQAE